MHVFAVSCSRNDLVVFCNRIADWSIKITGSRAVWSHLVQTLFRRHPPHEQSSGLRSVRQRRGGKGQQENVKRCSVRVLPIAAVQSIPLVRRATSVPSLPHGCHHRVSTTIPVSAKHPQSEAACILHRGQHPETTRGRVQQLNRMQFNQI